jgi:hypothetical protein
MCFEEKYQKAIKELEASGIWKSSYNPPLTRALNALGFKARPPHYASPLKLAAVFGFSFGMIWGIFMWVALWRFMNLTPPLAVSSSIFAGFLFGAIMSAWTRFVAKRKKLSHWDDL